MGYSLFREPIHRQRKFPANAHEQFDTRCTNPVSHAIRIQQSPLCRIHPVSLSAAIPSPPGRVYSARLAAECCQCV